MHNVEFLASTNLGIELIEELRFIELIMNGNISLWLFRHTPY